MHVGKVVERRLEGEGQEERIRGETVCAPLSLHCVCPCKELNGGLCRITLMPRCISDITGSVELH